MNASEISVGKTYSGHGKHTQVRTVLAITAGWATFAEQSGRNFKDQVNKLTLDDFAEWADGEVEKLKS